ncbi:MAG: copper transport protein [Gaiellaceae bacterium]|nr:copper transport protein [Gaiellaceae bacterium]
MTGCVAAAKSVLAIVLAVAAAGVLAGEARAHALLVRSTPADGAMVRVAPSRIELSFGEALSSKVASLRVVDGRGNAVRGVAAHLVRSDALSGSLPRLRNGVYAVTWQVMSEDDGHLTSGTLVFGVGRPAVAAATAAAPRTPPADALLHWLAFTFTALLFGGLAVSVVILRPIAARVPRTAYAADRGVLALAVVGALGAVLCQFALIERAAYGLHGIGFTAATRLVASTRWGELGLVEIAVLIALGLAAAALRARPARTLATRLAVALSGAVVVVAALDGLRSHAAATRGGAVPDAAAAIHLLGASVWLGGVAALAVGLAYARGGAGAIAAAARGRFAVLAGGAAAVVAATGLYQAGLEVTSLDGLLVSFYGRALLVKTALAALVVGLGALNFVLLRRRGRLSGRIAVAELTVGAVVLLAAGVLAASLPARGPQWAAPRPVRPVTIWAQQQDLLVAATIRPNRPGRNLVGVVVTSSRRPAPATVTQVRVRRPGGALVPLPQYASDRYLGSINLPGSGAGALDVVARRAGRDLSARLHWRVETPDPARATVFSRLRVSTIANPAAALIGLGSAAFFAALALAAIARRRAASWPNGIAHEVRR